MEPHIYTYGQVMVKNWKWNQLLDEVKIKGCCCGRPHPLTCGTLEEASAHSCPASSVAEEAAEMLELLAAFLTDPLLIWGRRRGEGREGGGREGGGREGWGKRGRRKRGRREEREEEEREEGREGGREAGILTKLLRIYWPNYRGFTDQTPEDLLTKLLRIY